MFFDEESVQKVRARVHLAVGTPTIPNKIVRPEWCKTPTNQTKYVLFSKSYMNQAYWVTHYLRVKEYFILVLGKIASNHLFSIRF